MSTASYKNVILDAVTGVLRPAGFRKSGSRFNRALNDVVHLVTVQSSVSSAAHSLRTTINLGVWVPALADEGAKPDIWSAHWRERLGFLMPECKDRWWDTSSEAEAAAAALEIGQAMRTFALTKFDTLATADALAALWRSGRSPGLTKPQADRYLERYDQHLGCCSKATERFRLVRGEDPIGVVTHAPDECVDGTTWDVGWLEPAPGFECIRALFEQEQDLFDQAVEAENQPVGSQTEGESARLLRLAAAVQQEIMLPGVWLERLSDDVRSEVKELHIEAGKVFWR